MPGTRANTRFGHELTPTTMLMDLARHHGVEADVGVLLDNSDFDRIDVKGMPLSDLLVRARTLQRMSLPMVQEQSGLSVSQLKYYENGFQKNPGVRTLHCLACGYNLPFVTVLIATIRDTMPPNFRNVRRRTRDRNRSS